MLNLRVILAERSEEASGLRQAGHGLVVGGLEPIFQHPGAPPQQPQVQVPQGLDTLLRLLLRPHDSSKKSSSNHYSYLFDFILTFFTRLIPSDHLPTEANI